MSDCWSGCVSDKILTQESGILDLLEPGDTVLADRGFTIDEDVILHGTKLEMPAFTRGRSSYPKKKLKGPSSYPKFTFMLKGVHCI